MKKVVLNKCYGGFELSPEAYLLYAKKKGMKLYIYRYSYGKYDYVTLRDTNKKESFGDEYIFFTKKFGHYVEDIEINNEEYRKYNFDLWNIDREDKTLVEVVEELGEKANGLCANLVVVEIPEDLDYVIDDYDGMETLHEDVRTW